MTKPLSPREREILLMRKQGRMFKEIAFDLGISLNTVQSHTQRAFRKLQVNSSVQAIQLL